MNAHGRLSTTEILDLLAVPKDGRLLTFGGSSAVFGLEIAVAREDLLIVVCDVESETTTEVADRATAEKLGNLVIGDTPAGPLVDRALCVDLLESIDKSHLVMIRTAMLPGGYAIFVEPEHADAGALTEKLKTLGYQVADAIESPAGSTIIRAR
jgi:hypothetical protein